VCVWRLQMPVQLLVGQSYPRPSLLSRGLFALEQLGSLRELCMPQRRVLELALRELLPLLIKPQGLSGQGETLLLCCGHLRPCLRFSLEYRCLPRHLGSEVGSEGFRGRGEVGI
jgi:hypothetical protein